MTSTPVTLGSVYVQVRQYYPQGDSGIPRMADRMCMSSTCAMMVKFHRPDALLGSNADDDYLRTVLKFGDTTDPQAQLKAIEAYGLKGRFTKKGSLKEIYGILAQGRPVGVGWLHYGTSARPLGGGHWTLLIGVDGANTRHHDPYGEANMVSGGYTRIGPFGKDIRYSRKNWEPRFTAHNEAWLIDVTDPKKEIQTSLSTSDLTPPPAATGPDPKPKKSNFAIIAEFLLAMGFASHVVAGIIGNFQRETGADLRPDRNERGKIGPPSRRGGYGLAQWTGVRQDALIDWAKAKGLDVSALETQLRFFQYEVTNTWEKRVVPALLKTKSPEEAALVFERLYERAGVPAVAERKAYARAAYERIKQFYG